MQQQDLMSHTLSHTFHSKSQPYNYLTKSIASICTKQHYLRQALYIGACCIHSSSRGAHRQRRDRQVWLDTTFDGFHLSPSVSKWGSHLKLKLWLLADYTSSCLAQMICLLSGDWAASEMLMVMNQQSCWFKGEIIIIPVVATKTVG